MKKGDLSKVFIGFMALLCMVAGALCIDRYRLLNHKIDQMKLYNESLRKSEKVARSTRTSSPSPLSRSWPARRIRWTTSRSSSTWSTS